MAAEAHEKDHYEEDDRAYLESLILQLKDKDPEKSKAARTELETMRSFLNIALVQVKNALKVLEVSKNSDQNLIEEKRKERSSLSKRIDLIERALYKSIPIPNARPYRP